jgi:hypothetical protein
MLAKRKVLPPTGEQTPDIGLDARHLTDWDIRGHIPWNISVHWTCLPFCWLKLFVYFKTEVRGHKWVCRNEFASNKSELSVCSKYSVNGNIVVPVITYTPNSASRVFPFKRLCSPVFDLSRFSSSSRYRRLSLVSLLIPSPENHHGLSLIQHPDGLNFYWGTLHLPWELRVRHRRLVM